MVNVKESIRITPETPQSVTNGQTSSITLELSKSLQTIDSILEKLRTAKNGNSQDNLLAENVDNLLSEVKSRVISRPPILIWQNPNLETQEIPPRPTPVSGREKPKLETPKDSDLPVGEKTSDFLGLSEFKKPKPAKKPTPVAIPEGVISQADLLGQLGISEKTFYRLRLNTTVSQPLKIGLRNFYTQEQVDAIKEAKLSRPDRRGKRSRAKEDFGEFEDEYEGNSLNLANLHLKEIAQIPMEVENHQVWGEKISAGKLALLSLTEIAKSPHLTERQKNQVLKILENNVSKDLLNHLHRGYDQCLAKREGKRDKADKYFIKSFEESLQTTARFIQDLELIKIGEAREQRFQDFIEEKLGFINEAFVARENFIQANLRLVVSIAKKFLWSGMELADLEGYGQFGLMTAVVRWDARKGYNFSTYATWWIRQSIDRAVQEYGETIRLPFHMHEQLSKLGKRAEELLQESNGDLDFEALARGVDKRGYLAAALRAKKTVSLSTAVDPDGDTSIEEFLEDVTSSFEETGEKIGLRRAIVEVLETLLPREREVLMLRYGLEDGKSRSLEQVAEELERRGEKRVTRERIRQIEDKALRKCRHSPRARKLRSFVD